MTVFVDTSAFYALFDRNDNRHTQAQNIWRETLDSATLLLTSNYVLLELSALLQRRFGMEAIRDVEERLVPVLTVTWVSDELHRRGVAMLLAANRRQLSLVDCVSFAVCRQSGVHTVFAFDAHFTEQGFELLGA